MDIDNLLNAEAVADMLGVSTKTLSRWARTRKGPPRVKIGRKVLYRCASVSTWLVQQED
jgi:predicted DNA-binding transcriptional regulator AlpA